MELINLFHTLAVNVETPSSLPASGRDQPNDADVNTGEAGATEFQPNAGPLGEGQPDLEVHGPGENHDVGSPAMLRPAQIEALVEMMAQLEAKIVGRRQEDTTKWGEYIKSMEKMEIRFRNRLASQLAMPMEPLEIDGRTCPAGLSKPEFKRLENWAAVANLPAGAVNAWLRFINNTEIATDLTLHERRLLIFYYLGGHETRTGSR
ncbi:hypothetical protein IAR55_000206 [Kwoniella newhampshirensis]|uniref:Uncharacterized protein n=1 Tax=Kwoniella newhampshirensis TaxID=1651941 RepID=A0AAW0Z629_9TREE